MDVAVIGGGLAGCAAAITLAQQGRQVALIEAKTYPHHKVCGEFLSPECAVLFEALGFPFPSLQPIAIRTAHITAPNGTSWTARFPEPAWGISRYALDAALADHARRCGVMVYEGVSVHEMQGNLDDGFTLDLRSRLGTSQLQARAVIGAHGKRSTLDRALERDFLNTPQPYIGLKNHFRGARLHDHIHLYAFAGGYCGMSEVEGGLVNVCLLVRQELFQQAGGDIPRFIAWMKRQNPRLGAWLDHAEPVYEKWLSISQIAFSRKPLIEQDVLMTGDAAGLIAPLAGNGMAMALCGGRLAAQWADRFLAGEISAAALKAGYPQTWQRQFSTRLRLGSFLQTLMLRPSLITAGLRLAKAIPPVGSAMLTYTRQKGLA